MPVRAYNYHAEQPQDPPEPTDEVCELNLRNGLRDEICEAIDLIDDRLGELDEDGFEDFLHSLSLLRDEMRKEMEEP